MLYDLKEANNKTVETYTRVVSESGSSLVIRRTTGLESANLRTKNTQKDERKPAKILEL